MSPNKLLKKTVRGEGSKQDQNDIIVDREDAADTSTYNSRVRILAELEKLRNENLDQNIADRTSVQELKGKITKKKSLKKKKPTEAEG